VKSWGWGGGTPTRIKLLGGFKPGRIYELTYTARDPMIVSLGMAGIRHLLSYLRAHPLAGAPAPQRTLIFGISQSARLIQTMLLRGLHVDEDGKPVFDGAFLHVAGAGKGGFDYRFAMPTRPSACWTTIQLTSFLSPRFRRAIR
jgi:hypothetical protein